jgi:choline-sulfatase
MTDSDRPLSRRRFLRDAGLAAGALTLGAGLLPAMAGAEPQPFTPRGRLTRRPNFLVIMVDEKRVPMAYESERLLEWRRKNLRTEEALRRNALEFTNHYAMATACSPSRASIWTGQYPSLHGLTTTSGIAKRTPESDLYWLDPTTVPTMGHWFRAGGYDTYYKGKWHVSEADLYQPGSYDPLPSYTAQARVNPRLANVYLKADRLDPFGFHGWVGPDPHGSSPLNSGSSGPGGRGRDQAYAQESAELLRALRTADRPWLAVTSFVNPHDIVLWGLLSLAQRKLYLAQQLRGSNVPLDLFTDLYTQSNAEDLSTKPTAQASYKAVYQQGLQPTRAEPPHQRFYYQLQKNVDEDMGRVFSTLKESASDYRETIVIFLSDHGELLGAHGGLFQKWHNAYEESIHVPLMIHNPTLFPERSSTDLLTSHADLLPTMLGLAGLDEEALRPTLIETHTQVQCLPGRDLSGFVLGVEQERDVPEAPQYFMTDDAPFRGQRQIAWNNVEYFPVIQPNSIESVLVKLPTGKNRKLELWKYSRYFENTAMWSSQPAAGSGSPTVDVITVVDGTVTTGGPTTATRYVKSTQPNASQGQQAKAPDEIEVYNVSRDPAELTNLATDPASQATIAKLAKLLAAQRKAKRHNPVKQPYTDNDAMTSFVYDASTYVGGN